MDFKEGRGGVFFKLGIDFFIRNYKFNNTKNRSDLLLEKVDGKNVSVKIKGNYDLV